MARIALLDKFGELHSVAIRLMLEGHDVRYWIHTDKPEYAQIGKGIVKRVTSRLSLTLGWRPECVIAYRMPAEAESMRKEGLPVWGSSRFANRLEDDRMYGIELAKSAGIEVPETKEFTNVKDAAAFAKKSKTEAWVFKAEGADLDCSSTHVTKSIEELMLVLDYDEIKKAKKFILQEVVEGLEISCEGWYDHRVGWVLPINSTLERKLVMPGDIGPAMGCMGNIVWTWLGEHPRLFKETIAKVERVLEREKFIGPIDQNSIIATEDQTPYILEWTPRLGWSAFDALMVGFEEGELGDFLVDFAKGRAETMPVTKDLMASVRLYIKKAKDAPIIAPWEDDRRFIPKNVWHDGKTLRAPKTDDDMGLTCVMEVAETGPSVKACMKSIYEDLIPQVLSAEPLIYRNDIGKQAHKDLKQLVDWGYETPETDKEERA